MIEKELGIQQGGLYGRPFSQLFIVCMPVEMIHVPEVGMRYTVEGVLTGKKSDALQHALRQIGEKKKKNSI